MMRTILQRCATRQHNQIRFMSKEIKFGVEGRAAMLKGVDLLADAVQVSFPNGQQKDTIFLDSFLEFRLNMQKIRKLGIRDTFPKKKKYFSLFEDRRYPTSTDCYYYQSDSFHPFAMDDNTA